MVASPATASAPSRCLSGAKPRAASQRSPGSLAILVPSSGLRRGADRCLGVRAKAVSGVQSGSVVDDGVQRPWKLSDARLVLEDGSVWRAKSLGASGTQVGEVVFNTSLTGYQEILTDPSYAGQFVLMTNPHIGNTGVNPDDEESNQCFLAGLIIRNLSICTSNWRCTETLEEYLTKRNIMGIYDVDTRAITRRLREDGSLIGVLSTDQSRTNDELLEMARKWKIIGVDLISGVTCDAPYEWSNKNDSEWEFKKDQSSESFHVVAYDFGIKHNILRRLTSYGCKITVVPANWPASEVLNLKPDGVLFSNGPGDPAAVPYAVKTVQEIIGKVPVFGICMGHQLIGQALGGKTFKMKFGHHGGNHPVCDLRSGRVDISAQDMNHIPSKRRGGQQHGGNASQRSSIAGTNSNVNASQRIIAGGTSCNGNDSERSSDHSTGEVNGGSTKRGRKKKSRTQLKMPSRAGKIALRPNGDKQFKYANYMPQKDCTYQAQLGVILRHEYPGVVEDKDEQGRTFNTRPALTWDDYFVDEDDAGMTAADRVKNEFWHLFKVSEDDEAEADRVLENYASDRVKQMMYNAHVDAVKEYYKKQGEEIDDTLTRPRELEYEQYLIGRIWWCNKQVWLHLCRN